MATTTVHVPGPAHTDVTYHGAVVAVPGYGQPMLEPQVAMVTRGGDYFGLMPHVPLHSPAGFAWGYAGSGPTDLARSLLIHALGRAARCRHCHGVGTGRCRPGRCCRDGYRTDLPVAAFKDEYVTRWAWREEWTITRSEILAWLATWGLYTSDPQ